MNFTATISVVFRLVQDTFRQSMTAGICWLLMGVSTVCIVGCLSVTVTGPKVLTPPGEGATFLPRNDQDAQDARKLEASGAAVANGTLSLAFGAVRVAVARDVSSAVHFVQLILAAGVADTLGLLLTLVWTAGFLPNFLAPQALSVLLAKPVPRWALLAGKYIGVLAFVLAQGIYFVGGTWLALGLRTGVWDPTYLVCIPLLLLQFAIFFGFSLLLAVCYRSTVICVTGSIAFWGICWAINFGRHAMTAAATVADCGQFSSITIWMTEIGYWIMPKPVDLACLSFDALGAQTHFRPVWENAVGVSLWLSVLTSLAFAVYLLVVAERHFAKLDY
jgi:ABC-type transport system involved in multi-copper enzyme maturation permease subunit